MDDAYPFRSILKRCVWCNADCGGLTFLTRRIRNTMDALQDGESREVIECEKHHKFGAQIDEKVRNWQAQERAKFETALAADLPTMRRAYMAEILGEVREEPPVEKKVAAKPKRPATAIPIPPVLQ